MVIEPIFESTFAPTSYGFRPGRGCKDALREVERLLHVVDVDIKGYFDNIPHEALMSLVKERVSDGKVLGLIESFLKQGVLEEGIEIEPEKGSPQGGVVSPLLANIYLVCRRHRRASSERGERPPGPRGAGELGRESPPHVTSREDADGRYE